MNEKYIIYGLFNPINDTCFYIGQTKRSLKDRLRDHIVDRKTNYFKTKLITEISNVGLKPIIFEIITIEDYYIKELGINYWQFVEMYCIIYMRDVLKQPLTNIAVGGYTCWTSKSYKKVKQFDLKGNYIKTHKSYSDAARSFKDKNFDTVYISIARCCKSKQNSAMGFQWCKIGNEDKIVNDITKLRKKVEHSPIVEERIRIRKELKKKKKELYLQKLEESKKPEIIELRRLNHLKKVKEYQKTDKGKEIKRKYYQTDIGKIKKRAEVKRYRQTPYGKEKTKLEKQRYREKNKQKIKEYNRKRNEKIKQLKLIEKGKTETDFNAK